MPTIWSPRLLWTASGFACCWAVALLVLGCAPPATETPFLGNGPVIIFDVDTLRADHLGCYDYDRDTSPRMDALANEGYRFEWAFSQAPMTLQSQGSIFTGLYPRNHGLILDKDYLAESLTTMAEVFSDAGYRTAAFVDGGYMSLRFGFPQGFDLYEIQQQTGLAGLGPGIIQWLEEHADERFFLLIHTYDVHFPYEPPEPYRSMFLHDIPRVLERVSTQAVFEPVEDFPHGLLNPHDLAHSQALYDGGIRYTDHWIGRILDVIERLGLDRRATMILLSDHGEAFQEHGVRGHSQLYTPVTRIPLVIRPPGGTDPRVIPDTVQSIDIMPTLLDGVGLDLPPGLQGRSLIPLLRGEPMRPLPAFSESPPAGLYSAANAEHHLVYAQRTAKTELYAFRQDPLGRRDVVARRPQVINELKEVGQRWYEAVQQRGKPDIEHRSIDQETLESLRSLGYIE